MSFMGLLLLVVLRLGSGAKPSSASGWAGATGATGSLFSLGIVAFYVLQAVLNAATSAWAARNWLHSPPRRA